MLISWNVTKECNLACAHCYRDAGTRQENELSPAEGKALLAELKSLGFSLVIFSGGEPLLRKDLFELIDFARGISLAGVLGTNGTLIDRACARRLRNAGLKRAGISLDSAVPAVHDDFRRCAGAWQKAVSAMEHCAAAELEFQVHTTVTAKNINGILEITDFAEKIGARAHHIFFLVPTGRGKSIDNVVPSAEDHETLLRKIMEKQKSAAIELKPVCAPQFMRIARTEKIGTRFRKGCLAGISYACILPDGEVHPCPYLPVPLGNVRTAGFAKIWRENQVLRDLRSGSLRGKCGVCGFKNVCSGCRAAAYYQSGGDYLAADENCLYEPGRKKDS